MRKEQSVLRDRIRASWVAHPVSTRVMAEAYLAKYPGDGFIWAIYGETLRSLGCFDDARTALLTARGLVDDTNKGTICEYMGDERRDVGDYPGAERWYREGAALEPDRGKWQLFIGVTLRRQGRDREAEECYRRALSLEGYRDEYLLNLGYVLQARGALQEAAACYEEALTIDPDYDDARKSLEDVRLAIAFQQERVDGITGS